jgi:hypothetical protein
MLVYDERKFAEALLYVAGKLADDPAGGAIKINKALFNADFAHMRAYGHPITGAEYQKLPYGPAPRRLLPVRTALVPLRDADIACLAETERQMLDEAVEVEKRRSGTESSAASHREPGWQMAEDNETIPYETAFLRRPVVTEKIRLRVAELAAERSLP